MRKGQIEDRNTFHNEGSVEKGRKNTNKEDDNC